MESSCERMNCKTQKKTQLLCKSRAFEHLRISYRDTTVHAGPGLCVLQAHRTARNDHLLLLLSRGPPRAVNAFTLCGFRAAEWHQDLQLDSLNTRDTTSLCTSICAQL